MKRAMTLAACVMVGVTLGGTPTVSGQTNDPRIGRWQVNIAKSRFNGPAPKSITRIYEDRGGGNVFFTGTTVTAAGMTNVTEVLYKLDGKDYPQVPRGAETVTVVSQRLNGRTIEAVTKRDGKVVSTFTQTVSADGKTLTYIPKDADGKPAGTQVFDKQTTS